MIRLALIASLLVVAPAYADAPKQHKAPTQVAPKPSAPLAEGEGPHSKCLSHDELMAFLNRAASLYGGKAEQLDPEVSAAIAAFLFTKDGEKIPPIGGMFVATLPEKDLVLYTKSFPDGYSCGILKLHTSQWEAIIKAVAQYAARPKDMPTAPPDTPLTERPKGDDSL